MVRTGRLRDGAVSFAWGWVVVSCLACATGGGGMDGSTQAPGQGPALLEGDPSPTAEPAIYARAEKLIHAGRVEDGLREVEGLLKDNPEMSELHYVRGNALSRLDRDDDAYAAHETAARLAPQDPRPRTALARLDAWSRGDLQSARTRLLEAVEVGPTDVDAHLTLALVLHDLRDLEGAAAHLERARALMPQHPEVLHESARVAAAQGDFATGASFARAAVQVVPGVEGLATRLLLARLLARSGDPGEAALEFQRVLKLGDEQPDLTLAAMRGLVVLGTAEPAIAPARALVERFADEPAAHVGLARVLAAAGQLDGADGALAAFDRAISLAADNRAAHHYKTQVLAEAGRCAAARKSLSAYRKLEGADPGEVAAKVQTCRR